MPTVLLQARMGSRRLPGKAFKTILKHPLIFYVLQGLEKSPVINRVVLATTYKSEDDILVDFAKKNYIDWFRGSEFNVLERMYLASQSFPDTIYFRATADNPIIDFENPERILNHLKTCHCDYAAEVGMPVGSVVEVFTSDALRKCYQEAQTQEYKEHVTLYMKRSQRFKVQLIKAPSIYYYPGLRLTVDFPGDFEQAKRIIENTFLEGYPNFSTVLDYVRKNGLI